MKFYWTCSYCQSNLDFGESCDCDYGRKKETVPLARKRSQKTKRKVSLSGAVQDVKPRRLLYGQ